MRIKLAVLAVASLTALVGTGASSAQTNQSGLVNVNVQNNTVQVPIGIAANVCGVAANILAQSLSNGPATCTSMANATATRAGGGGGGGGATTQNGLVNLNIQDNVIQVPVAVAANICGIAVNLLAQQLSNGGASCDATGNSSAGGP
jgi:hypothetical protein